MLGSRTSFRTRILGSRTSLRTRLRTRLRLPRLVLRPTLRISYLKYTGFKGKYLASNNLSLAGPRIG